MIEINVNTNSVKEKIQSIPKNIEIAKLAGLRRAATILKDAAIKSFQSKGIGNNANPKYNDTLIEGIRRTGIHDNNTTVSVHILGTGETGSGTFRLRFFEGGTKKRMVKTYKGKPLKKPRYVGRIRPTRFFESAINGAMGNAMDACNEAFENTLRRMENG